MRVDVGMKREFATLDQNKPIHGTRRLARSKATHSLRRVESGPRDKPQVESEFSAGVAAVYAENGLVARAIMEWRHKVVMLYVVTLGAGGSSWLWLYDHNASD